MQTVPPPDVDTLVIGGKVRKRRRNLARVGWAGLAAAAAVLIAGGVYGVMKPDPGNSPPSATTPPSPTSTPNAQSYEDNGSTIQPGTYRMFAGIDDAEVPIYADLTFDDNVDGVANGFPVLSDVHSDGGVAVYRPVALSAGTGCLNENKLNTELGKTPQALAQ